MVLYVKNVPYLVFCLVNLLETENRYNFLFVTEFFKFHFILSIMICYCFFSFCLVSAKDRVCAIFSSTCVISVLKVSWWTEYCNITACTQQLHQGGGRGQGGSIFFQSTPVQRYTADRKNAHLLHSHHVHLPRPHFWNPGSVTACTECKPNMNCTI